MSSSPAIDRSNTRMAQIIGQQGIGSRAASSRNAGDVISTCLGDFIGIRKT
jgi:hypothetical protein